MYWSKSLTSASTSSRHSPAGASVSGPRLAELIVLARSRGVTTLTATVQPDNDRIQRLIRRLLPESTFTPDDDVYAVVSPLH